MGEAIADERSTTVEIKDLSFTYPGIDGHPPPGSAPLIDGFSLTLHAGNRCLLVGSNGAGESSFSCYLVLSFLVCVVI